MLLDRKLFLILALVFSSSLSLAKVWETENYWNEGWEDTYREWMKSERINKRIFADRSSPYYGVKVDCADAAYALRAIFAYEHKLEYRALNSRRRRNNGHPYKYITNELDKWDSRTHKKRVVAFINYLGGSFSTRHLSSNDTFPLALSHIKAGDIFMHRHEDQRVWHTYVLKNVNNFGNFDLLWSTPRLKRLGKGMEIFGKKNQKLSYKPMKKGLGFKRFRWHTNYENLAQRIGYSMEQYALAKKKSDPDFFSYVQNALKRVDENENQIITRTTDAVCDNVKIRLESVNQALEHLKNNRYNCMDYNDYDAYSTPSRDKKIKSLISDMKLEWKRMKKEGSVNRLTEQNEQLITAIFAETPTEEQVELMLSFCPITYKKGETALTLNQIINSFDKGLISFHPNDNVYRRWGIIKGSKTGCKVHYE